MIKIKDLAKKIAKIFNVKIKLQKKKLHLGGTNIRCPDIKKLKREVFFKYKFVFGYYICLV